MLKLSRKLNNSEYQEVLSWKGEALFKLVEDKDEDSSEIESDEEGK